MIGWLNQTNFHVIATNIKPYAHTCTNKIPLLHIENANKCVIDTESKPKTGN